MEEIIQKTEEEKIVANQEFSPYFNPELETMSRADLEKLQLERLQKTVPALYEC